MAKKQNTPKSVEALKHAEAKRKNIPTAEYQSILEKNDQTPLQIAYERRNRDLDPQLVWRGKDVKNWSDLVVSVPPLYIQEKVHPKVLIDDLLRQTRESEHEGGNFTPDLFADFNGIPKGVDKTEFYQHDQNWSNRMILGDSLQVMASLAEREGLRGKVQCIYIDPPYGIKFNSNFQWSTTSREDTNDKTDKITREPEQVKAFRDTWRDGIHSYLTYLRDRLTVALDLLADSGSIFVQIGDENVHLIRALVDEIFGSENFVAEILIKKTGSQKSKTINSVNDYVLFYAKSLGNNKFRRLYEEREMDSSVVNDFPNADTSSGVINLKSHLDSEGNKVDYRLYPKRIFQDFKEPRLFSSWSIMSYGERPRQMDAINFNGEQIYPSKGQCWSHTSLPEESGMNGMQRLIAANRIIKVTKGVRFKRYLEDFPYKEISNWWDGFGGASNPVYVVQTNERLIERCILMSTDPGDLVIDPTCGSGTTAYVAEQWGRRWITVDTSRVALALARARIMGARYPYYYLADTKDGQIKEGEITKTIPSTKPVSGDIRHGFVCKRAPHIMSSIIANNTEIDAIWDRYEKILNPIRESLNKELKKKWKEWEIPREAEGSWSDSVKKLHAEWWQERIARQNAIDVSISAKAEPELLYDQPYDDKKRVRVAGPFTVESLSPHRVLGVDENDELIDGLSENTSGYDVKETFTQMIIENLKTSGVQQAHKEDRITFTALTLWPGEMVCAEGRYLEGEKERRAAIFIGPEFGTVQRADLVQAAKEAGDADFGVLIACAFNYEAHATEFNKLGRIPVLKARMNADLHMAGELKNTGKGNLFVIFGEPDIDIISVKDGKIKVKVNGVDVFHPNTGEVLSDNADGIACWFIDTDYNEESFFVRHAYFLGANDPYSSLKTTLKAEINQEAWETLHSDISRPFEKPKSGRIAVKVINHLGDEVMKVFKVN